MAYFNGKEWVSSTTPYTAPKPKTTPKPETTYYTKMATIPNGSQGQTNPTYQPGEPVINVPTNNINTAKPDTQVGAKIIDTSAGTGVPGLTQADLDAALADRDAAWQSKLDAQNGVYEGMLNDFTAEQQKLAEAQRASRIASLGKARDSTLSGLDAERATIDPYYYDKRNQTAASSDVGAMDKLAQSGPEIGKLGHAGALASGFISAGVEGSLDPGNWVGGLGIADDLGKAGMMGKASRPSTEMVRALGDSRQRILTKQGTKSGKAIGQGIETVDPAGEAAKQDNIDTLNNYFKSKRGIWAKYGIDTGIVGDVAAGVLQLFVLFGVLNNPTDKENF